MVVVDGMDPRLDKSTVTDTLRSVTGSCVNEMGSPDTSMRGAPSWRSNPPPPVSPIKMWAAGEAPESAKTKSGSNVSVADDGEYDPNPAHGPAVVSVVVTCQLPGVVLITLVF